MQCESEAVNGSKHKENGCQLVSGEERKDATQSFDNYAYGMKMDLID